MLSVGAFVDVLALAVLHHETGSTLAGVATLGIQAHLIAVVGLLFAFVDVYEEREMYTTVSDMVLE